MDLNISITIANDATPREIAQAINAAAASAQRYCYDRQIPELDADQLDVGATAHHFGVPRSFEAVFYRSA